MDDQVIALADELRAAPLLRALEAGWTTPQDRVFAIPILAWAQAVLVAEPAGKALWSEGENCSYYYAAIEGQSQEHAIQRVMAALPATALNGPCVPSFARHFADTVLSLQLRDSAVTVDVLMRLNTHVAAQIVKAIQAAMDKANSDAEQASGGDRHESPDMDSSDMERVWKKLLPLYLGFFMDVYNAMRFQRLEGAVARIQARKSLELAAEPPMALSPGVGEVMCTEADGRRGIEFSVERYPCAAQVLDPRVVRIPPGKFNNCHKHAHETLFYFISGVGEILVGKTWVKVKPGDAVFAPRWAIHQTHNTGDEELVLLAITDYYLTSQVYIGKYDKI